MDSKWNGVANTEIIEWTARHKSNSGRLWNSWWDRTLETSLDGVVHPIWSKAIRATSKQAGWASFERVLSLLPAPVPCSGNRLGQTASRGLHVERVAYMFMFGRRPLADICVRCFSANSSPLCRHSMTFRVSWFIFSDARCSFPPLKL